MAKATKKQTISTSTIEAKAPAIPVDDTFARYEKFSTSELGNTIIIEFKWADCSDLVNGDWLKSKWILCLDVENQGLPRWRSNIAFSRGKLEYKVFYDTDMTEKLMRRVDRSVFEEAEGAYWDQREDNTRRWAQRLFHKHAALQDGQP